MAKKKKAVHQDPVVKELSDLKRLLILQLMASGVKAGSVAAALEIDQATLSRLVPARLAKKTQ